MNYILLYLEPVLHFLEIIFNWKDWNNKAHKGSGKNKIQIRPFISKDSCWKNCTTIMTELTSSVCAVNRGMKNFSKNPNTIQDGSKQRNWNLIQGFKAVPDLKNNGEHEFRIVISISVVKVVLVGLVNFMQIFLIFQFH